MNIDPPEENLEKSYPSKSIRASRGLKEIVVEEIAAEGTIPFSTFMERALYHPELGYYLQPGLEVGKKGDFYTSVSVGKCFGLLLSRRLAKFWRHMGQPGEFVVSEAGAHGGQLAYDILEEAAETDPDFFAALSYRIVEPQPRLRKSQEATLEKFSAKCSWSSDWKNLSPKDGAILSNELFDAFPVDLITLKDGQWQECQVRVESDNLVFCNEPIHDTELQTLAAKLPARNYPENYLTECARGIEDWVSQAAKSLKRGLWLSIDYGFNFEDYYLPERSDGTLRAYQNHRMNDQVLENPGRQDLTADVDFTRLANAGTKAGFSPNGYADQARYLTAVAKSWLMDLEKSGITGSHPLLRQFQTLTHPTKLGTRFQVMEMVTEGLQEPSPFLFSANGWKRLT